MRKGGAGSPKFTEFFGRGPHEKFVRFSFYLHPPHVAQCPLHFFVCVPVAENIVPL